MFEEVPRPRRGLAGHIMLGPFVIGGVLLAVGGSVAVAATVISSAGTRTNDVPPPVRHPVVATSTSTHHPAPGKHRAALADRTTASSSQAAPATSARPTSRPPAAVLSTAAARPSSSAPTSTATPATSPAQSPSGPAGNALIFVSGFDSADRRVQFTFAEVSPGTGPGGSDVYRTVPGREYSAILAGDATITSAGQLCPPAGSRCSVDQLAAAAATGFFAIAAIDPTDQLHSIIEVDNVEASFAPATAPSLASPSPTGS